MTEPAALKDNEFRVSEVPPGSALLVGNVAVFNVAGGFCATQAKCTHRQGPLSEGRLDGSTVTCPYHRRSIQRTAPAPCCAAQRRIQSRLTK